MPLADRVVLITGATGGLGTVVTRRFAETGARLGLVGTDRERLVAVASSAGLAEDRWVAGVGDLTDRAAAEAVVATVVDRFGRVDVLLHLVGGYAGGGPIASFADDDLHRMLGQHLWSTLNVARAVIPGMVERGWGRILGVTSFTTVSTPARAAIYATTKSAQETLLRVLAKEVASTGVTVNMVAVRAIDAVHAREREPSPKNASWTTPEEVVATFRFLCSDEAAAINGARIPLDGRA